MKKKILIIFVITSLVICFYYFYRDETGDYYKRIFLAEKIQVTNLETGKSIDIRNEDLKGEDITLSFSLVPKNKSNITLEDKPLYEISFIEKNKILQTVFIASAIDLDAGDQLPFQPSNLASENTLVFEYDNEHYISYTQKYFIQFSSAFYECLFDELKQSGSLNLTVSER